MSVATDCAVRLGCNSRMVIPPFKKSLDSIFPVGVFVTISPKDTSFHQLPIFLTILMKALKPDFRGTDENITSPRINLKRAQ
jgi:hypothetical protein